MNKRFILNSPFEEQLRDNGLESEFNNFIKKISKAKINNFDRKRNIKKIRFNDNFRILIKEFKDQNDSFYYPIKLYVRSNSEYTDLSGNDKKKRETILQKLHGNVDENYCINYIEEFRRNQNKRDALPSHLEKWFEVSQWEDMKGQLEIVVCETEDWINQITQNRIEKNKSKIRDFIESIPDLHSKDLAVLKYEQLDELTLYYVRRQISGVLYLVLLGIGLKGQDDIQKRLKDKYSSLFNKNVVNEDVILQNARKAYPFDYIMASDSDSDSASKSASKYEVWYNIEENNESNLALSTEEQKILRSLTDPNNEENSLPVFINGRAGSGKSTILYYLFSQYCAKKIYTNQEGELLFVTYSNKLMEMAKKSVESILKCHYHFVAKNKKHDKELIKTNIEKIKKYFRTFESVLLDYLPLNRQDYFLKDNRVTFEDFKKFYRKSIIPTGINISPETAWHVIRTYIKGYRCRSYLTLSQYKNIERKDKTVSNEDYELIYNKVWNTYKKFLASNNLWDDQDLVREVLQHIDCLPVSKKKNFYSVIFCDESQDYTRIELEFILKISIYSTYNLSHLTNIKALPFAFAGDPLQTLTPTGFSWNRFKAMFYDGIVNSLCIQEPEKYTRNMRNLTYNYRSDEGIVRFSNTLQLIRKYVVNEPVEPQKPWFKQNRALPRNYLLGDRISLKEFIENTKETTIIIPADEGSEIQFVKDNEILLKLLPNEDLKTTPSSNIYSAILAKGLEFDKVVLFNFGSYFAKSNWEQQMDQIITASSDKEYVKDFALNYFLNKLYVAITRAKKDLIILETDSQGCEKFWNKYFKELFVKELDEFESWRDFLEYPIEGSDAEDFRETNPLKNAEALKSTGISEKAAGHLQRAKRIFKNHKCINEAKECQAWIERIEKNYNKAGEIFDNIGLKNEAFECYWEGCLWKKIKEFYGRGQAAKRTKDWKYSLAVFMLTEIENFESFLKSSRFLFDDYSPETLRSYQFQAGIHYFKSAVKNSMNSLKTDQMTELCSSIMDSFMEFSMLELLIHLLYKGKTYKQVINLYDKYSKDLDKETVSALADLYWMSKALTTSYPDNLVYLSNAKNLDMIIEEYNKSEIKNIGSNNITYIVEAYFKKGLWKEALNLCIEQGVYNRAFGIIKKRLSTFVKDFDKELMEKYMDSLLTKGKFSSAIDLASIFLENEYQKEHYNVLNILFELTAVSNYKSGYFEDLGHMKTNDFFSYIFSLAESKAPINIINASASLERIGCRYNDMLPFYEMIMETYSNEPKILEFARKRWLAVKKLYNDKYITGYKHTKNLMEIKEKSKLWGISSDQPEFPDVYQKRKDETKKEQTLIEEVITAKDDKFSHKDVKGRFEEFDYPDTDGNKLYRLEVYLNTKQLRDSKDGSKAVSIVCKDKIYHIVLK